VDWRGILQLTEALAHLAPTLGARVAVAAARAHVDGPDAGIAQLDHDQDPLLDRFQPAWATRAQLLADAGRRQEAAVAYQRAISLTTEPAVRMFLNNRVRRIT
jgi:RNA polymerase sigma-70 factor (ECF subfamily)